MNYGKQLYELQQIDLEVDENRETLERVDSQLSQNQTLIEMRNSLDQERERFAELEKKQRMAEWEAEELGDKIAAVEGRLYGGSVTNPRELAGLQQETEHLKARLKAQEDEILDIMDKGETMQSDIRVKSEEVSRLEKEWQEQQTRFLSERAELVSTLASLTDKRHQLQSQIDPTSLELYEMLRTTKQGRAVAKVEQGMCQGCRITLSMTELQKARLGQALVQCSNCKRILYVS